MAYRNLHLLNAGGLCNECVHAAVPSGTASPPARQRPTYTFSTTCAYWRIRWRYSNLIDTSTHNGNYVVLSQFSEFSFTLLPDTRFLRSDLPVKNRTVENSLNVLVIDRVNMILTKKKRFMNSKLSNSNWIGWIMIIGRLRGQRIKKRIHILFKGE